MQGFNMGRYLPPESLDRSLSASHTPGFNESSRAKRGPAGAQTVRFEMPFAIWCTTCQPEAIIGQGIRFNAEKKKVGNYYSTPIWSFRMRHGACGGEIEIRTDPEKREYVVHEGGRRRETGVVDNKIGVFGEILTEEEREQRRTDAFAHLEGKKEQATVSRSENEKVQELLQERQKHWEDPYLQNQKLRKEFRVGRKVRAENEKEKSRIVEKLGLGIELLDANPDDAVRAASVDFANGLPVDGRVSHALSQPLFGVDLPPAVAKERNVTTTPDSTPRSLLIQQSLVGNTLARVDPFSGKSRPANDLPQFNIKGLKRKRETDTSVENSQRLTIGPRHESDKVAWKTVSTASTLVEYDSSQSE